MRAQKIITENGKDYLIIALPVLPESFTYGFVSDSGKSFVFRNWNLDKTIMVSYRSLKLKPELISGRIINSNNHFHKQDIISFEFNGILLPCVKIYVSKSFK
jgi:hypothetical protein